MTTKTMDLTDDLHAYLSADGSPNIVLISKIEDAMDIKIIVRTFRSSIRSIENVGSIMKVDMENTTRLRRIANAMNTSTTSRIGGIPIASLSLLIRPMQAIPISMNRKNNRFMGIAGADRFLNCVLHRSDRDVLLSFAVMLIAVIGVPGLIIWQVVLMYIDNDFMPHSILEFYIYILFMSMLIAFFAFWLTFALHRHHERDVEWTASLAEYAEGQGKNTIAMEALSEEMETAMNRKFFWIALALFVIFVVSNVLQGIFYFFMSDELALILENFTIAYIAICMSLTDLYVMDRIQKMDSIQSRFSQAFSDSMVDEVPVLGSMNERKHQRLWPHAILMVVTLGLYGLIYLIWVVHTMNGHIKKQWVYEREVLEWMMAKDNVDSIDVSITPRKLNLLEKIYRFV